MKILAAKFVLEANENVPMMCDIENVVFDFGQKAIEAMQLGESANDPEINLVPIMSANASSSGVMKRNCFNYIETRILDFIKENLDLDGMYLHLHGASEIEGLGSGDHHLLKEIRKVVGPYVPICVACDPHGNLCKEYVESVQLIRSYRHSPHTDIQQTNEFVLGQLKDLIKNRQSIHAVYRKLPMILGGEQSVSTDEPVASINKYLDEMEKDSRVRSASWHVGYIRHDSDVAGCGVVVVPQTGADQQYCEEKADELAKYVFDKRHEFHYTGVTAKPEEALQMALNSTARPNFVTDSGDNVTSGATGANTFVLRQVMALEKLDKKVLFASIHDEKTYAKLSSLEIGTVVDINLGANYNELSAPVSLRVEVKYKGAQVGTELFGEYGTGFGNGVLVSVVGKPVDIIVADTNHPFVERKECLALGVDWFDYDVTVVKCGYAFPELVKDGKVAVMSLTEGATLQDTSRLPFKRIMRPMFPIDNI